MDKSSMSISRNNINSEKINIHLLNYIDSNVIIFSLIGLGTDVFPRHHHHNQGSERI